MITELTDMRLPAAFYAPSKPLRPKSDAPKYGFVLQNRLFGKSAAFLLADMSGFCVKTEGFPVMNIQLHKVPVARTLVSAGQAQQIGPALLTTGAAGWLTLSPDKVTRPSLPVANKVTDLLNLWSGLIGALVGPKI